jgi:hypothetical protein
VPTIENNLWRVIPNQNLSNSANKSLSVLLEDDYDHCSLSCLGAPSRTRENYPELYWNFQPVKHIKQTRLGPKLELCVQRMTTNRLSYQYFWIRLLWLRQATFRLSEHQEVTCSEDMNWICCWVISYTCRDFGFSSTEFLDYVKNLSNIYAQLCSTTFPITLEVH